MEEFAKIVARDEGNLIIEDLNKHLNNFFIKIGDKQPTHGSKLIMKLL